MTPGERSLRADTTRLWLRAMLEQPTPARTILQLAKQERISLRGLRRAKRRLKVVSVRTGGLAWRGKWVRRLTNTCSGAEVLFNFNLIYLAFVVQSLELVAIKLSENKIPHVG